MNSYEIDAILKKGCYTISLEELAHIYDTSKQIAQINLLENRDVSSKYEISTGDGYKWSVAVSNK